MMPEVKLLQAPLFERVGGTDALVAVIDRFYEMVLGDAQLVPFFDGVDLEHQKEQVASFLTEATGGPANYDGLDMEQAHRGLGIEASHFDAVAGHLVATLNELGVSEELIAEIVGLVGPLASSIIE